MRKEHERNLFLLKRPVLESQVNLLNILWISEIDILELHELALDAKGSMKFAHFHHGFLEGIGINGLVVQTVHQIVDRIPLAASRPTSHEHDLTISCPVVGHDEFFLKFLLEG